MKRNLFITATLLAAGSLLAAPKDDVQSAVKKLADAGNYSWTSTSTNQAGGGGGGRGGRGGRGGGPQEGKITKDGIAHITSSFGGNTFERVVKGDKSAIKNQEGVWQTPEELAAAFGGGGGGGGGGRGRGGFGGATVLPAVQAADLVSNAKEIKLADGVYSSDLTEDGAKSLMTFGGRGGGAAPTGAKGSVKFWVKDGTLAKYEFNVQGTIAGPNGEVPINRTTTIEIKDIGTTKVEVPEDAKKKLSS